MSTTCDVDSARSARAKRGYTMIEVMTALAVLALGATGVIAIEKAALAGNANARSLATANMIAMTWAERMKVDALAWNNPSGTPDLTDTVWLNSATAAVGQWFVPTAVPAMGASPAADIMGQDIMPGQAITQAFCTQVRLTRLYPTMIRAEIRVFWARNYSPVTCAGVPQAVDAQFGQFGFVVLTTGVSQNTAP
jgi:type IV pilus assembly protein PilV